MGFFSKMIGLGLIGIGISKVKENVREQEENRLRKEREIAEIERKRKGYICYFDGKVTREEFYAIVTKTKKQIRRLTYLYAEDTVVYGRYCSQSGITEWNFKIDFNDYGQLTGRYWLSSENKDSNIPKVVADRISERIKERSIKLDDEFVVDDNEAMNQEKDLTCQNCGKKARSITAKYCVYCGEKYGVSKSKSTDRAKEKCEPQKSKNIDRVKEKSQFVSEINEISRFMTIMLWIVFVMVLLVGISLLTS